ncbi:MAG: sugar ABC transporter ATP-binding protein [Oscillospiraceae bacterium]|nr:sugar ABC transporter ATP-binding protein [Oscillospiraceae bacterium]
MTETKAPILELKHIMKAYDANVALKDAGLTVYPGEIHALMGANGAGKSTMIKIIAGAHKPNEGEIILNGEAVTFNNPKDALRKGVAVVYQELSLVPHLTVSENIALSADSVNKKGRYDWAESDRLASAALKRLGRAGEGIGVRDIVGNLRADQMQMIEIARAIGQDASIILLDEPTSSLNFEETENLFAVIRELVKQDIAIIFVSHRMNEIREICDRISILRDGILVVDGRPMSQISDDDIVTEMLGEKLESEKVEKTPLEEIDKRQPLLTFGFEGGIQDYVIHEGEIIGLAGLAGSGRSSVLRAIWGGSLRDDMHFEYMGEEFKPTKPSKSLGSKMAYVGEDRAISGLFFGQPILETIIMGHRNLGRKMIVNNRHEQDVFRDVIRKIQIKIPAEDCSPSALSGGNQQKLLFGRWIIDDAKLILLDEPTRGVDVRTKEEIYQRIRTMAAENNAGVLMVSSELNELELLCDRVIVMRDGKGENVLSGDEITEENMMRYIAHAEGT